MQSPGSKTWLHQPCYMPDSHEDDWLEQVGASPRKLHRMLPLPDEPKQAAKDAVSAAKDSLPEPPSNPFQSFFSGKLTPVLKIQCCGFSCDWSVAWRLRSLLAA